MENLKDLKLDFFKINHDFLDIIGEKRDLSSILKHQNMVAIGYFHEVDSNIKDNIVYSDMVISNIDGLKELVLDFDYTDKFHLFVITIGRGDVSYIYNSNFTILNKEQKIDVGDNIEIHYDSGIPGDVEVMVISKKDILSKCTNQAVLNEFKSYKKEEKIKEGQAYIEMINDMKSKKVVDELLKEPRYYITKLGKQSKYDQKIASFPYYGEDDDKSSFEVYDRVKVDPKYETSCVIIKKMKESTFDIKDHGLINNKETGELETTRLEDNKCDINVIKLIKEAKIVKDRYETDIHESYRRIESLKAPILSIDELKILSKTHGNILIGKTNESGIQWEIRSLLGEIFDSSPSIDNKMRANKAINLIMELMDMDSITKMDCSDRLTIKKLEK